MKATRITLKKDTEMVRLPTGRGVTSTLKVFPAGTEVIYSKKVTVSGTYHTVHLYQDGARYEATRQTKIMNHKH